MQNHKSKPRAQVTPTVPSKKSVLPHVRYHPSIQMNTPADIVQSKTSEPSKTSQAPRTRPAALYQHGDNNNRVALDPAAGPQISNTQKTLKQVRKPVERAASDRQSDRPILTPAQLPLGLKVVVDRDIVKDVEVLTRGQRTNQHWFSWRKNRITASVAHQIAHSRFVNGLSKTPASSYLTTITGTGPNVQTRAMSWGVDMEEEAIRQYEKQKTRALGRRITVQNCGLFIDNQRPWLAGTPDGIVVDSQTGKQLLCLEVKCPYKHRHNRVEEACRDDPAFCLEINEDRKAPGGAPVYRLKKSHKYFTQVQCQLAVTGMRHADFVVYTTKETAIVPITFDPDLWEETVSKLEVFYRDAVLPHLRERAAAWAPEQ